MMSKDPTVLETLMKAAYTRITALEAEVEALRSAQPDAATPGQAQPIAVIGLGCRLPGAAQPEAFWQLLTAGRDAVTTPAPTRWQQALPDQSADLPVAGFLDQVDHFDPLFFRISPREAQHMDPEQRLLLEVAWEALEHAGIPPHTLVNSATGVFIGQMAGASLPAGQEVDGGGEAQAGQLYAMTGALSGFAPGRLSYFLGAQGPSMAIDCSCSAALMSVHLAVQSLRRAECTLAIAGGVHLLPDPAIVAALGQWQLLTGDGRCKTFDAAADGYGLGEGCGLLILKRLGDAQRDGDPILAVILGSATNHDGPSSGLTVPNGRAQQAVIRQALADAGVAPQAVGYIEANGIGTPLGDTMEVDALGNVFGERSTPLWLGAVTPNVGHLDAAAGMPALIKAILAIQHGVIPPNVNFHTPNPLIDWGAWPIQVPTTLVPWTATSRIAGVSSFGLSGSNVHLVLGQVPTVAESSAALAPTLDAQPLHLLTLSAKSEEALRALAASYGTYLAEHPEVDLADLCYTANAGRSHFAQRAALVFESSADLAEKLAAVAAGQRKVGIVTGKAPEVGPKIVFLCSGLGAQSVDMGRQLYDSHPIFRQAMDRCDEILADDLGASILDVIYPGRQSSKVAELQSQDSATLQPCNSATLQQTLYAETALFALEYALAQLWRSWGIEPDLVLGHSVGEYVAACLAGVFSLEDALKLVVERAKLIESASATGATAVIFAEQERVEALLAPYADQVTLAGINSPNEILVAGLADGVEALLAVARQAGLDGRRLDVAHAAHSPCMEPILDTFAQLGETIIYHAPQIKLISSVNGEICRHVDAAYWRAHLRQPVRFDQAMQTLQAALSTGQPTLLIELGPQPVLLWLGRQNWTSNEQARWLPSLRSVQTDWQQLFQSLAELYGQGVAIDWRGVAQGSPRKVVLPTYPFQRQRYALSTPSPTQPAPLAASQPPAGLNFPGLDLAIEEFQLRQLPTTSNEWWYHAKQGAQQQWQVRILDGDGHCIAETTATAQPRAAGWSPTAGIDQRGATRSSTAVTEPFAVDPAKRDRLLSGQTQHRLPNGLTIAHLNPYETEYVYKEIFVDRCYLKHGITLQKGDTVVDIGANIGLFSLFVQQEAQGATIYAFEPSPSAFQALQSNAELYLPGAKVFPYGIAAAAQSATFTFYPNSSVFSSFHADAAADGAAIRTVVENMVRTGHKGPLEQAELASLVDELMVGRMASQSFTCQLYALSDIIQAEQIGQIDLLKIDAEKSEVAILQGIRAADWPKIKQIVIEVHEQGDALLDEVTGLLRQHGFTCAVEEETFLQNSGLFNIFATRVALPTAASRPAALSLQQQLQGATVDEQQVILVDYLRIVVAQIAGIDGARVDVASSLMMMGVDSLLAIEMRNQVKQALGVTLPIATVLENSLTTLARLVAEQAQIPHPNPPLVGEGTVDEVTVPPLTRGRLGGGKPSPAALIDAAPISPLPSPPLLGEGMVDEVTVPPLTRGRLGGGESSPAALIDAAPILPHPNPPLVGEGMVDEVTVPPLNRGRLGGGESSPATFQEIEGEL